MTVIQIYLRNLKDRRSTAHKSWQKLHEADEMLFFAWFNITGEQAPKRLANSRVRARACEGGVKQQG